MTTFTTPLKSQGTAGDTGNSQTETSGYVNANKTLSLGVSNTRQIVSIPPFSTLIALRACVTSAGAPVDPVSAFNVSFGNSGQAGRYGVVGVSAVGRIGSAIVSASTDFDAGGTIVVVVSAVSTTTFTAGGVRAFIEYATVG